MAKLRRQVIILTLCLIAVLVAKRYVDQYLKQAPVDASRDIKLDGKTVTF